MTRLLEIAEDRHLRIVERDPAKPGPEEVRVAVEYCGICGSDIHMRRDPAISPGTVLGHEFAGTIEAVGSNSRWTVGARVAVVPYTHCGDCHYCKAGAENHCMRGGHLGDSVVGVGRDGGLAESVVVPDLSVVEVGSANMIQGALAEPVAVAIRSVKRARIDSGDAAVIVGAGPIGVLVALVLRRQGCQVRLVEPSDDRRQLCASLGLDALPLAEYANEADAADWQPFHTFVCTGAEGAVDLALRRTATAGHVVVVGLAEGKVSADPTDLVLREVTLVGSAGYSLDDFREALTCLGEGAIPDEMVTTVVPLSEADGLFDELASGMSSHLKVMVRPRD